MALAESLFAKLTASGAASAAYTGVGDAARVFPGQAPAGTPAPYIVINVLASQAAATHDATSDFDLSEVQFSCVAETYKGARDLARAVRADLSDVVLAGGEKAVDFTFREDVAESVDAYLHQVQASIWHNPSAA